MMGPSGEKGKLYLIPMVIADGTHQSVIPLSVNQTVAQIRSFLCENVRTARRFISSLKVHDSIESLHFAPLDKDTAESELPSLFAGVERGEDMGVLSESGCPGVADPGAQAVRYAHVHHIKVVPLVGPSSLLLGLMASGFNGQQFAFHGYLPVDPLENAPRILALERESKTKNQTQIFIETPYRNNSLLSQLIKNLHPSTRLCVAIDLTSPGEKIISQSVAEWKKMDLKLEKSPALFLFLAG